ncbi:MAG: M56 family metallopeptidase [Erysipelotrichaceae bacterium]|nr:M56 family metallopeptidase [Erysipelotrichaceae bacterium]
MLVSVFMKILDLSLKASIVIVAVCLIRLLMRKMPKKYVFLLWAAVWFRLLCPLELHLPVYTVPFMEPLEETFAVQEVTVNEDATETENEISPETAEQESGTAAEEKTAMSYKEIAVHASAYIWFAGVAAFAIYSAVSLYRLKKKLIGAVRTDKHVLISDYIDSPFVIGIFSPDIYLPSSLDEKELEYILLHENSHIERRDTLWKTIAFAALALHWFNPLVWISFILFEKDMEMSCDEAVIEKAGSNIKADYSETLLTFSSARKKLSIPLAFDEGNPKERIRHLSEWKKPGKAAASLLAVLCIVMSILFLSTGNRKHGKQAQYNQYLHTSFVALTNHNAVISNSSRLLYTVFDPLKEPGYLCYDPSCNHRDSDCSSYIGGQTRVTVFGSADYVYYPLLENDNYGFYRMTYKGTDREKLFDFPYQSASGIQYLADFNDPYVSILVNTKELNDGRGSVLIRDINDTSGDWKCIFGEDKNRSYGSVFYRDGWYFASYMIEENRLGLEAYRLSDGKRADVTDEWDLLSASDVAVAQDHFIWTKQEDGFYTKGFDDEKAEKISSLEKGIDLAQTFADDEFFYLVNTSARIDELYNIPKEERGMKIYDRQGNLLLKLTADSLGFRPCYLWSEENRIVFANTDKSSDYPYFYILRKDIRNRKAEIHMISEYTAKDAEQNDSVQVFDVLPDQETLNVYEEAFSLPMEEGMKKLGVDSESIRQDNVIYNMYILNETTEYESEGFEILLNTDLINDNERIYAVTYRSVLPENSEEAAVFVNHMFEEIKKTYGDPDTYEGLENRLGEADIILLIERGSPASVYEEWNLSHKLKAVYKLEVLEKMSSVIMFMIRLI